MEHALNGSLLARVGAMNGCQLMDKNVDEGLACTDALMNELVRCIRGFPREQGYMNLLVRTATNSKPLGVTLCHFDFDLKRSGLGTNK